MQLSLNSLSFWQYRLLWLACHIVAWKTLVLLYSKNRAELLFYICRFNWILSQLHVIIFWVISLHVVPNVMWYTLMFKNSFLNFNISQSWLCENCSFFYEILLTVLLLPSRKYSCYSCLNYVCGYITNALSVHLSQISSVPYFQISGNATGHFNPFQVYITWSRNPLTIFNTIFAGLIVSYWVLIPLVYLYWGHHVYTITDHNICKCNRFKKFLIKTRSCFCVTHKYWHVF